MNPRVQALRARIHHHGLSAFLVSSTAHIRYLFGFTGSNAIAIVTSEAAYLFTDRRYRQQAIEQVSDAAVTIVQKDLYSELSGVQQLSGNCKIGIESPHLSTRDYFFLRNKLPDARIICTENVVERIAAVKSPTEIENVRTAAAICLATFKSVCHLLKPGVAESEISAELSYQAMRAGSERDPFEPIVASGERSALPHGVSSRKRLSAGDFVILDFGATTNGYAADFTRTVVLGKPTTEQSKIMQTVEAALNAAEAAAVPGMAARDLDKVARTRIADDGYAEYFQHALGHGLGLNVHELPRVSEFSKDTLEVGNIITMEPGIYVQGVGGVRIEDDFVVTEEGVENLTPISREVVRVG